MLALYSLIKAAYDNRLPRPRYAYIAPLYRQGKAIAWDLLKTLTRPIPGTVLHEAELRADLAGGARVQVFGADSPDTLRGLYFDGVVLDECAQMKPRLWPEIVRPTLVDRAGWAIMIGTPLGHNHFYDLYQQAQADDGWHAALYKASATGIVPQDELDMARRAMSPEQYAQEFEASFESALIGAYYAECLQTARDEGRITAVPHDPTQPVYTSWDLGVSDSTAIWFVQHVGQRFHVIDYLEASDHGMEFYARALAAKPYTYARHLLPHDIEHRDWSANGHTRLAMLQSLGVKPIQVVPRGDIGDGIQATRNLCARLLFDQEKCHAGLEALANYRREWDEEKKNWSSKPRHDWASHGSDSLRCFAMGWHEEAPVKPRAPQPRYEGYTGRGGWMR